MLSDEQLLKAWDAGVRSGDDGWSTSSRDHVRAGLRAVEAAVRADQIKKDAVLAKERSVSWFTQPDTAKWADGERMNLDSRMASGYGAELIAAAIRAQLTEGNTDE